MNGAHADRVGSGRPLYVRRQPGTLLRIVLGAAGAGLVALALNIDRTDGPAAPIVGVVALVVLLALLLLESLTVRVTRERLEVRFGPGLIRRSFRIADILEARPVRNRWFYGWGIRLTPHGWLYNVSGLEAVELTLGDGRTCRIGTDQPQRLVSAIAEAKRYG